MFLILVKLLEVNFTSFDFFELVNLINLKFSLSHFNCYKTIKKYQH